MDSKEILAQLEESSAKLNELFDGGYKSVAFEVGDELEAALKKNAELEARLDGLRIELKERDALIADLRDFAYNRAPILAAEVNNELLTEACAARKTLSLALEQAIGQRDEANARIAEAEAELELQKQIYTHTDNDIAIVNAQLRGSYQANETLKRRADAADARAEAAEKVVKAAVDWADAFPGYEAGAFGSSAYLRAKEGLLRATVREYRQAALSPEQPAE